MNEYTKFLNNYEVNGLKVYTDSDKKMEGEFAQNYFKNLNNLKKDIKPFLNDIKKNFESRNLKNRYILFTGQAFLTCALQTGKLIDNIYSINDIDIFIMDYQKNQDDDIDDNNLFDSVESDNYDDLSSTNYGYDILGSEKFNYVVGNAFRPLKINYVFFKNYFSEFLFKSIDQKDRFLSSYMSTLDYFDINLVQSGFMIDLETMDIVYLYTEKFYNFLINKQLEFNKKRISKKSLERILKKANQLTVLNSWNKPGSIEIKENVLAFEKIYMDESYFIAYSYIFNKLSEKFYESLKIRNAGKTSNNLNELDINLYENLVALSNQLEHIKNPINQSDYIKREAYSFGCYQNLNRFITRDRDMLHNLMFYIIKNNEGLYQFKINNLQYDYKYIDESLEKTKNVKDRIDFIIELLGGLETFEHRMNPDSLVLKINSLITLSNLSQKKLLALKTYFEKKDKSNLFLEIITLISIEPKLLNFNISDLQKLAENGLLGHDQYLFKIPFKYTNSLKVAKTYLLLFEEIDKRIEQIKIDHKDEIEGIDSDNLINKNIIIGEFEKRRNRNLFWKDILFGEREILDTIQQHVNNWTTVILKELKKDKIKFHDLKRIKFEEDNIICEELITPLELKAEGNLMHHCVGGYAESCAEFRTTIFRVYPKNKNPLSSFKDKDFRYTFEINIPELRLIQTRGKRNKSVEDDHKKTIDSLVKNAREQLEIRLSEESSLYGSFSSRLKQPRRNFDIGLNVADYCDRYRL